MVLPEMILIPSVSFVIHTIRLREAELFLRMALLNFHSETLKYLKTDTCPSAPASQIIRNYGKVICIESMLPPFNSHVSTSTNQCIDKAIHTLLMHRFGTLNILIPGHNILYISLIYKNQIRA